ETAGRRLGRRARVLIGAGPTHDRQGTSRRFAGAAPGGQRDRHHLRIGWGGEDDRGGSGGGHGGGEAGRQGAGGHGRSGPATGQRPGPGRFRERGEKGVARGLRGGRG